MIVSGGRLRNDLMFGELPLRVDFRWVAYSIHSSSEKARNFWRSLRGIENGQEGIGVGGAVRAEDEDESVAVVRKVAGEGVDVERLWTVVRKTSTIFSIGSDRKRSTSGWVRG